MNKTFKAVLEQLPIGEKSGVIARTRFVPIGELARLSTNCQNSVYGFMNYQLNQIGDECPTGTIVSVRMKEHKTPSGYTEYTPARTQRQAVRVC
mgnify:CR=1 FL=1